MMTKWSDLKKKVLSPERIDAARDEAQRLVQEIQLKELRKILGKTQEQIAAALAKKQASLSKMENQKDWMISTLAAYLRALGANLRVFAEVNGAMYPLLVVEEDAKEVKRVRGSLAAIADSVRKDKAKKVRREQA